MIRVLLQTPFLDAVSSGFRNNPVNIAIGLIVIVLILLIVILLVSLRNKDHERKAEEQAEREYLSIIEEKELDAADEELIERLFHYSNNTRARKVDLLKSRNLFLNCERDLLAKEKNVNQRRLAALRVKLNFGTKESGKQLFSTTEIPPKTEVLIKPENLNSFQGVTGESTPDELELFRTDGDFLPGTETRVKISFQRDDGVYTVNTQVLSMDLKKHRLGVEHTEHIDLVQNRKYFRQSVNLTVGVRTGGSSENYKKAQLHDISGGGCSVENPGLRYRMGNHVEVYLKGNPPLRVLGEVVRFSEEKKIMHLSFDVLKPTVRDRLIGYVLRLAKAKESAENPKPI